MLMVLGTTPSLPVLGFLRADLAAAQERSWEWGTHPMMWGWGAGVWR